VININKKPQRKPEQNIVVNINIWPGIFQKSIFINYIKIKIYVRNAMIKILEEIRILAEIWDLLSCCPSRCCQREISKNMTTLFSKQDR
jgi:hypothetical protein